MKLIRIWISLGLVLQFPVTIAAQTLHQDFRPVVELAKTGEWTAQRLLVDGKIRIRFELPTLSPITYMPPIPSTLLVSGKLVNWNGRTYLLTSWQEGVSTSALRVFDPLSKEQLVVFERYSIGEVGFKITDRGLEISVAESGGWSLEPVVTTSLWSAP